MRVSHVVGARPNFVKAAPVIRALDAFEEVNQRIIHTGQHYDPAMSDNIMRDVGMRTPDINLEIGSGSHATQTARALVALESDFINHTPDIVVVYGDVNSTLAGALAASKLNLPIVHVEAGLRSFDRTMPEEINRIVVDSVSDFLFVTSEDAVVNLSKEGISKERISFVGNTMIDSLTYTESKWRESDVVQRIGVKGDFAFVTLHRPSNVDIPERLQAVIQQLRILSDSLTVVFPVHPRTRAKFHEAGLTQSDCLKLIDPVPYLDSISLISQAKVVITDSGGVQEETTHLGVPCLTVRTSTERPITVTVGTNHLIGIDGLADGALVENAVPRTLDSRPRLWDGEASLRIANTIVRLFCDENFRAGTGIRSLDRPEVRSGAMRCDCSQVNQVRH